LYVKVNIFCFILIKLILNPFYKSFEYFLISLLKLYMKNLCKEFIFGKLIKICQLNSYKIFLKLKHMFCFGIKILNFVT